MGITWFVISAKMRGHRSERISSPPPCPKDMGHPTKDMGHPLAPPLPPLWRVAHLLLEVGEPMTPAGSHHQMIGQLPSQSIFSTDSSSPRRRVAHLLLEVGSR